MIRSGYRRVPRCGRYHLVVRLTRGASVTVAGHVIAAVGIAADLIAAASATGEHGHGCRKGHHSGQQCNLNLHFGLSVGEG